jgi:hypothetical protein
MSVYSKLFELQTHLNVPKGQRNNFGKYNYRTTSDILKACKPLLTANKCIITLSDEIKNRDGRYYIIATAKFTDIETGESVLCTGEARESENKKGMDDSQITGSTSSYARKFALSGLLAIDDEVDPDREYKAPKKLIDVTDEKFTQIKNALINKQATIEQALFKYDLTEEALNELKAL